MKKLLRQKILMTNNQMLMQLSLLIVEKLSFHVYYRKSIFNHPFNIIKFIVFIKTPVSCTLYFLLKISPLSVE